MGFSTRRGRPRQQRVMHDTGTPELNYKRLFSVTGEPLDLCLERGIITEGQHWCGLHFRWLYTLRYGAPGVRAIDPTHLGGYDLKQDDPTWRSEREAEYQTAADTLKKNRTLTAILELCVFNHTPHFLEKPRGAAQNIAEPRENEITRLTTGLDALAQLWRRRR